MSAPVAPAPTSTNAPASGVSGFFGSLFGSKKPANSSSLNTAAAGVALAKGGRRRKHSMKRSKRYTRRHRSKKSKSRRNRK